MDRQEDQGSNAVSRKALEVKGKIMSAPDKLSNWWKNRKKKKKDDGAPSTKKKVGQYAARSLLQKVPVVGAGMKIAAGVKEHRRAKVDDEVAADKSQDDFTRAMGTGLATGHRGQRNKEFVGAAVSLVKTGVDVGTHGVSALMPDIDMPSMPSMPSFSVGGGGGGGNIGDKISGIASGTYDRGKHAVDAGIHKASDKIHEKLQPENLAETAGEQVAKRGGAKGVDKLEELLGDGEKLEPHKLRKAAIAPVAATPHVVDGGQAPKMLAAQQAGAAEQQSRNEAGVDKANDNLLKLTAADPKMGAAVLNHLHAADGLDQTPGMEGIASNLAQAREMDPATTKKVGRIGSRKTVETEHNLKPSMIAAMVRGDAARKRQAERMGGMEGTLGKLTNNEKRGWWEAGADTDVHVPKKEEDEAESES